MKKLSLLMLLFIWACKKDSNTSGPYPSVNENITSMADFKARVRLPLLSYGFTIADGYSFTTSKGTVVTIPPDAFEHLDGTSASGLVIFKFKELTTKSEMVLEGVQTTANNTLLKSGGMFYVSVKLNGDVLRLKPNKSIEVNFTIPANETADSDMKPFFRLDSAGSPEWVMSISDTVLVNPVNYAYLITQFQFYTDTGSWGNCDDPNFYVNNSYKNVTFQPSQNPDSFSTEMCVLFGATRSMAYVYRWSGPVFERYFPEGYAATMVAVGVKNGKLYSAFVPFTTTSVTVPFTLTETTIEEYKSQLEQLN